LAFKRLGNREDAARDLQLYSRIDPNDAEVSVALSELGETRQPPQRLPEPAPGRKDAGNEHNEKWSGSGFFVSSEGHLITNAHVVEGCKSLNITHGLNPPVSARVLAKDTANDLALVLAPTKPEKFALIRVGAKVGEEIAAFGYPLLGLLATSGNFTRGNISSVAGIGDDTRYLQISAPIQKGNSGGPVVDQGGSVVGVVVSKLNVLAVASDIDDMAQNVNFAIKSSVLVNFLDTSGVSYSSTGPQSPLSPVDLAEKVKSFAVLVKCSG
jgi:S1-C subfamily serine protease